MSATPQQIAAAWATWKVRHKGSIGPGPGFVEAINAALSISEPDGWQLVPKELTPKIIHHLQAHSEIGSYVCENLVGAYGLMDEYHAALLQATKGKPE